VKSSRQQFGGQLVELRAEQFCEPLGLQLGELPGLQSARQFWWQRVELLGPQFRGQFCEVPGKQLTGELGEQFGGQFAEQLCGLLGE
jgi:hypothetical protein